MNPYRITAKQAGEQFILDNPHATGVAIDDAATKFDPCDPGRRWFQDAANWKKREQYYRWSVGTRCGRGSGGFADTVEDARERIMDVKDLYHDQGYNVVRYSIFNKYDQCVLDVSIHK